MKWIIRNRWTLAWIAILALAWTLRLHNALAYNPYWGYDGGAHLAYIETVAYHGRLPTVNETYQAWHAPLFYIISAGIFNWARILGIQQPWLAVQVFQAILGVAFVGLSGALAWEAMRKRAVALATAATIAVLPLAVFAGSYISNELMVHVLMLGTIVLALRLARKKVWKPRSWIMVGLLLGVAYLTKYSAALLVPPLVLFLIRSASSTRSKEPITALLLVIGVAVLLVTPWQIYRGALRFNDVEENRIQTLSPTNTIPPRFFATFDRTIFENPFWDSGSRGIWSMLYAQMFGDYDNVFGNVDADDARASSEKILTTSGRYVSLERFAANRTLQRFSIIFIPIILAGIAHIVVWIVRSRFRPSGDLVLAAFVATALAVTIIYSIRYPFIDRGTVKAIYILSIAPIIFMWGWRAILSPKTRLHIVAAILIFYTIFAWPVIWITSG